MSNVWQGASRGGLFTQTKGLSLFEVQQVPLLDFFTLQEKHQFAPENSNLIILSNNSKLYRGGLQGMVTYIEKPGDCFFISVSDIDVSRNQQCIETQK